MERASATSGRGGDAPAAPVPLTAVALDRADERRGDAPWLERVRRAPDTGVLVGTGDRVLLGSEGTPAVLGPDALAPDAPTLLLGIGSDGRVLLGADLAALVPGVPGAPGDRAGRGAPEGEGSGPSVRGASRLVSVRTAMTTLGASDAALVAYLSPLIAWHRRHRHCSVCGTPTEVVRAGHERRCPSCGAHHFPRTDPVVTMLLVAGDHVLLSHRRGADPAMWSALAGFVEPGEGLEQAVAREAREEVGLEISGLRYVGAQPWPFFSQLMIGFRAVAARRDPEVSAELADARWFERGELHRGLEAGTIRLPPPATIGHHLIRGWIDERS